MSLFQLFKSFNFLNIKTYFLYLKMITILFLITSTIAYLSATDYEFSHFMVRYNKTYESENEFNLRKQIFEENWKYIEDHNKNKDERGLTFTLEMNEYGDEMNELTSIQVGKFKSPFITIPRVHQLPANVD